MGYRWDRKGAPGAIDSTAAFELELANRVADRPDTSPTISGREVISNSLWGTGGFNTGRLVIPIITRRRHVLSSDPAYEKFRYSLDSFDD
jgi:hypothetical protein